MREKLIELLADLDCNAEYCKDCEFCNDIDGCVRRQKEIIADRLIANGVTVQKWIPVTERLPESEKCVLVYSQDGGVAEGKYNARFKEWVQFRWNVTELKNVTHWMPLPEPPKEVE